MSFSQSKLWNGLKTKSSSCNYLPLCRNFLVLQIAITKYFLYTMHRLSLCLLVVVASSHWMCCLNLHIVHHCMLFTIVSHTALYLLAQQCHLPLRRIMPLLARLSNLVECKYIRFKRIHDITHCMQWQTRWVYWALEWGSMVGQVELSTRSASTICASYRLPRSSVPATRSQMSTRPASRPSRRSRRWERWRDRRERGRNMDRRIENEREGWRGEGRKVEEEKQNLWNLLIRGAFPKNHSFQPSCGQCNCPLSDN